MLNAWVYISSKLCGACIAFSLIFSVKSDFLGSTTTTVEKMLRSGWTLSYKFGAHELDDMLQKLGFNPVQKLGI